jgi:uncharacterized protein YqhQ
MALRNGLLIHGPTAWALAARRPDGTIGIASGRKPVFAVGATGRVPVLRGPLRLLEALAVIPIARRSLPEARLPLEDFRVGAAALAATLATGSIRRGRPVTLARELAAATLGLAPAVAALRGSELAAYHGVEHKAIGAYESGTDPAEATKEHERCGSNLIAPLLVLSIAGQVLIERLLKRPGPISRAVVAVGSVSLAVEMFAWAERNPGSPLARAYRRPGDEIQRWIATREPTPAQLEVGSAALEEILRVESGVETRSRGQD